MSQQISMRDLLRWVVPPWMSDRPGLDAGYRYLYSSAAVLDLIIQEAVESARLRFPSQCDDEELVYHSLDRGIRRAPGEARDLYVTRLQRWRETKRKVGSASAILKAIRIYAGSSRTPRIRLVTNSGTWFTLTPTGDPNPDLVTIDRVVYPDGAAWDWDARANLWDRFWIILYASEWGWTRGQPWGTSGLKWGADPNATIGSTATRDEVRAIRTLIREHQAADAVCVNVIVSFDNGAFAPDGSGTLPDGTWRYPGSYNGSNEIHKARSPSAIYWKGTS